MRKNIPWHGKVSYVENRCPHCGADNEYSDVDKNEYSDVAKNVMELSTQYFKRCTKCQGEFVDTYLVRFGSDFFSEGNWEERKEWDDKSIDQVELFERLEKEGFLVYDDYEGREDSDYYVITPQSIHFITGEDNE